MTNVLLICFSVGGGMAILGVMALLLAARGRAQLGPGDRP
jgi:hypothetical protein